MDSKITLSFDNEVINKAKKFADKHHISLSRLTEYLYDHMTRQPYHNLEEMPLAHWISQLAEGKVEYRTRKRSNKTLKNEFFKSRG
jgi:Family of unknown function (DUF6364)